MKKLIFAFLISFSSLFAFGVGSTACINGNCYTATSISNSSYYYAPPVAYPCQSNQNIVKPLYIGGSGHNILFSDVCAGGAFTENGYFFISVSSCPSGTVLDSNGVCSVPPPTETSRLIDGDLMAVHYSDNVYQACLKSTALCVTYNASTGAYLPNRPIDGVTYNSPTDATNHKYMVLAGVGVAIGSLGTAILTKNPTVAALGIAAAIHAGLYLTASPWIGLNTPYVSPDPSSGSMKVSTMSESQYAALSGTTSSSVDGQTVTKSAPSSDGSYSAISSSSSSTTVANVSPSGAAQIVTIPTSALTDAPSAAPSVSASYPTTIPVEVVTVPAPTINADGSKNVPQPIYKAYDFTPNTSLFSPSTTITKSQWPNSEAMIGMVTRSSTSITSHQADANSSSSSTKNSTSISTTDANGVTTTISSGSSDLSGVTSRLDQMINQNTLLNGTATGIGQYLTDTLSPKLDGIRSDLNATNAKLDSIDHGLNFNAADAVSAQQTIQDSKDKMSEWATAAENLGKNYDDVKSQLEGVKSTISNGFANNLPITPVSTCAYHSNINFGFASVPFDMDICQTVSPLYPVFYFLFYLIFFISFLGLSFYLLVSSRSK